MQALPRWRGAPQDGYLYDVAGTKILYDYFPPLAPERPRYAPGATLEPALPPIDEEYLEWLDIVEAVRHAQDCFTMIELGAGFGRWIARGAALAQRLRRLPYRLVGVEAEPVHFRWMVDHLRANGIDPEAHDLIQAAVTPDGARVKFLVGDPHAWYGQALAPPDAAVTASDATPTGRPGVVWVEGVTLQAILARQGLVDLIDLDVQGAEFDVLFAAAEQLNRQVRRIHVGTHGAGIEDDLRFMFGVHGWTCLNDYACGSTADTPYGRIAFGDGVQTWVNPRLQP